MRLTAAAARRPSALDRLVAAAGVDALFDAHLDPAARTPVAVAVSGGGDSLALLLAARSWARTHGRPLLALHVDHGLQPASAAFARAAMEACADLGVVGRVLVWRGPKPATGVPAKARAARHALLADTAREAGACVILQGHTRDDVLENRLMRARGLPLGEPAVWSPSPVWPRGRGVFHFRPLLGLGRHALREALRADGRTWIEDPANDNLAHPRTHARRAIAERPTNPACGPRTIARCAALPDILVGGGFRLSRSALLADDAAGTLLAAALVCAGGGSRPLPTMRVRALLARLEAGEPIRAGLAGARIEAVGEPVLICREAGEARRGGLAPRPLAAGSPAVWDGRFELTAREPGWTAVPLAGRMSRLSRHQRQALLGLPAPMRGALPAVESEAGAVTCPILASDGPVTCRDLTAGRLAGALGAVTTESATAILARGGMLSGVLSWAPVTNEGESE